MKYIIVFVTASSEAEAEKIAEGLINSKLAACVNIIPKIKSIYTWNGKKEVSSESLLIIKTKSILFNRLKNAVRKLHSYTTPEIISIPIKAGHKEYLDWLEEIL